MLLASWSVASSGHAEPSPAERAIAEKLFERGRTQLSIGEVSSACDAFAESQRLDPGTGTLLNLAGCHETQGKLASAWVEFREAVVALRRENRPDRLRYALDRLSVIEPNLAYLTIMVSESPRGHAPVVRLDGRELGPGAWSVAIPVDAGWHEAVAQASKGGPWRATLNIENGQRRVVSVPANIASDGVRISDPGAPTEAARLASTAPVVGLVASPPPLVASAKSEPETQHKGTGVSGRTVAGAILGGLGLGAMGVGAYEGLHAASLWKERNTGCEKDVCSLAAARLGERAGTAATISTWTLTAGAVALGAGALLVFWPRETTGPTSGTLSVSLQRSSTGSPTGFSLGGVF